MSDFWDSLDSGLQLASDQSPAAAPAAAAPSSPWSPSMQAAAPLDAIQALYTKYHHGTPATPDQLIAAQGNPGGLAAIEAQLQAEPKPAGTVADAPAAATGSDFGAPYAAFTPDASTGFTPQQMRTDYIAPQFTEAAPTFTAPTGVTMENDPGYQFRLDRAGQAVQRSAAMKGTVLNPGTVSALSDRVGQQASAEFGNVFDRAATTFDKALATYGAKYNVFQGNAGLKRDEFGINNAAVGANNATGAATAQQRFGNQATTYGINYGVQDKAQSDYWNRLNDIANRGAQAAAA